MILPGSPGRRGAYMDEKEKPKKSAWSHDVKIGLEGLRSSVQKTRDDTAAAMAELQKELEKKQAILARLGRR
jgi:hypothetical protein